MAGSIGMNGGTGGKGWRVAMWAGAAGLLLVPAIAMQLTSEVVWGPEDFLAMALMLTIACGAFELARRMTSSTVRRSLAGVAILGIFLMVWVEMAVGLFR